MKMTLLAIVQNILNDMDSDDVNSISDTVESLQVAEIVRQAYVDMISNRNWPHMARLMQLEPSIDSAQPTLARVPERVKELDFVKYDKRKADDNRKDYQDVHWLDPEDFLNYLNQRNSSADNIQVVNYNDGVELLIINDKAPEYWTSFDDQYVVFDSFNEDVESTIQNTKTQVRAYLTPEWTLADDFIPDLPVEAFSKLVAEAKSNAFLTLKQVSNQKAEATSQRQGRWLSRKAWTTRGGVKYPDYGRRGRRGARRDPTFRQD